jgi:hypothetical protein
VTLALWPFADLPVALGWIILGALGLGFVLGYLFHLPPRIAAHRRAKRAEKRVAELETPKTP